MLEGNWKIVIINELMASPATPLRFSELERDGIVHRRLYLQVPPKFESSLTEFGWGLEPAMQVLIDWAQSPVAR